nr:MAG TPA: hypothetical protein [Caudoviricetes sp.]DAH87954.1 MAG TPA: hypothetical protein [Caudoviricetes sp.]
MPSKGHEIRLSSIYTFGNLNVREGRTEWPAR